jgi:hypothetical protein
MNFKYIIASVAVFLLFSSFNFVGASTNVKVVGESTIRSFGTEPASVELKNARVRLVDDVFTVAPTVVITAPSSGDVYLRKTLAGFFLRIDKNSERGTSLVGYPLKKVKGASLKKITYHEKTPFSDLDVTGDVYIIKAGKKATFNFLPIKANADESWATTGYYDLVLTNLYLIKNGLNYDKPVLLEDKKAKSFYLQR